jgi:hypothetical protein
MDGFDQPHPTRTQPKSRTTIVVGASRQLLGRIQSVHGNDKRTRERTILVRQDNGKILICLECVWIPFGYQFECKPEGPIALRRARRS